MQPNAADVQTDVGRDLVRPLLRHLPDVIFRLSRDGTFLEHIPTQGRRVGVFADAIVGLPVEQALPPDQAEETTRLLARALRSGEMQRLDYIVWEGDERHVVEGRVVATGDRDALLMLLDATERRSVVAASETIVETSYALLADDPIESVCDRIAEVLARHLDYPMARVSLWHPTVRGARLDARHGDAEVYKDDLAAAARQAEQTGVAAIDVGLAASVPICHSGEVLGTVSVADDRARRMLPSTLGTLESVAASLVGLRDRARVAVALAEQTRALRVYEDTGRLLLATLDLDEILDALSREVVETGVLRSLMVALVDERSQTIQVVRGLTREADGAIVAGGRGSIGAVYRLDDKNVTAEVARTGEMQVVRGWDDRYDDRYGDPERHARTVAYFIPVMKEGRVLAVLATGSQADQESEMLQRIEDMSGLLAQVAVALDHALLYRQTQTAREEMRAVMIGANCLLWHASVAARETHVDESDQFKWETRAFDVDAAQRFMQLYIADGDTYGSAWYASVVPEYVEPMRARAADALLAGRPGYTQEYRCVDATGATRWLYEDVHIDPVAPGRWNLIGVCTDITARKQVEQMKDEFISTVSHELRTPLTSILGALELVVGGSAGELPEQSLPLLKIARDNGRRLTRLVNDILDIDKIESGRVAFDMQTMELAPLIDTAIEANRPFAAGLDVELVFEGAIPGVEVDVDAGRFAQLMANLISNAVKFSPSHGAVTVTMHERDGWVRVSIADDGPGIPESARDDLFERFTQVDGSTTREHAGTGLGLAIAKVIVERLRGRIDLISEVGIGSTFFFDLRTRAPQAPDPREATVLVCAGDDAAARVLAEALDADDRVVEIAADVEELMQSADGETPDVVVLDASLAAPGPCTLVRRMRRRPDLRGVPIVVSRVSSDGGADPHLAGGFTLIDCIPRALDGERLLALATEAARRKRAPTPLILHVGADAELARKTGRALAELGGVAHAADVQRARDLMAQHDVDLAIIDLALPREDASDVLDAAGATPIVLVGAETPDGVGLDPLPERRTDAGGGERLVALVESVLDWDG